MKLKPFKRIPVLIALGAILAGCALQIQRLRPIESLEWDTYDWRVRLATHFPAPAATNLGFVAISDESIAALNNGSLGYRYGLYWPRHIYGRIVRELEAQQVKAAAFDVIFGELHPKDFPVAVPPSEGGDLETFYHGLHPNEALLKVEAASVLDSDEFFAWRLRAASNIILAAENTVLPDPLFATNALNVGDISAEKDADGVLRRARAFREYRQWHPLFRKVAADPDFAVDLATAQTERGRIVLPREGLEPVIVPLDPDGCFELADFVGDNLPAGMSPKAEPYTTERVWHMGIVLAAQELQLDLDNAEVDVRKGQITLRGKNGVERIIPVDANGFFYIDWTLPVNDPRLTQQSLEQLLARDQDRSEGRAVSGETLWPGKLAVIGSSALGNDLTDRGATPLQPDALLVSKHWNVANSVITGRFVRRSSLAVDLALTALMGAVAAGLTWQCRTLSAACAVLVLMGLYWVAAAGLYVQERWWLPIILPGLAVPCLQYACIVSYRAVFEEKERRRVKSIFSKLVSPNVVQELLESKLISLSGARREVTVMFADVRGFTELTDLSREQATEHVRRHNLTGDAAEACYDRQARETLATVNLYLALVAETVKNHQGTLDKYIGDCVMAFWGAPTPEPRHAVACVRAAIDAQRAIHELNQRRLAENQRRETTSDSNPPEPREAPLPTLVLGTGINTGPATVGLMGSDDHILNYTAFGREVNLASRLESLSGRGRILIGEATYRELEFHEPALAATCVLLPPAEVKGFRETVKVYEVPWRADPASPD